MGKSLRKIGYSIFETATNNAIIKDEDISIDLIYDIVHDVRSALVYREFKKTGRVESSFFTICNCLEIKCKEISCADPDTGETVGSGVYEYYSEVPFIDNSLGAFAFKYVGEPGFTNNYRHLSFPNGVSVGRTKNAPAYFFVDGRLIFKNIDNDQKVITISALTKNGNCDAEDCDIDSPYNIPERLIHELEGLVLKRLATSYGIKKDSKNNSSDDV